MEETGRGRRCWGWEEGSIVRVCHDGRIVRVCHDDR
jgi:hypothetical protein